MFQERKERERRRETPFFFEQCCLQSTIGIGMVAWKWIRTVHIKHSNSLQV